MPRTRESGIFRSVMTAEELEMFDEIYPSQSCRTVMEAAEMVLRHFKSKNVESSWENTHRRWDKKQS